MVLKHSEQACVYLSSNKLLWHCMHFQSKPHKINIIHFFGSAKKKKESGDKIIDNGIIDK